MPGSRNNSLKNPEMYEELRKDGNSKSKAARISNAMARDGKKAVAERGGESGSYDDWTVPELRKRAKDVGLSNYSAAKKTKLIEMLRDS